MSLRANVSEAGMSACLMFVNEIGLNLHTFAGFHVKELIRHIT